MNKILIFCFIAILVGVRCKKENLKDADLLNTKWTLSYIQDTKTHVVKHYPGDAKNKIYVVFNDTLNIVSFSGLCNGGAGTYNYSSLSAEIKVTDLITTSIGCKYVEWETYTVQNLYYASKYKINGNDLTIYSNGDYNLYFTKN
jgi:heat shock protein HslJ